MTVSYELDECTHVGKLWHRLEIRSEYRTNCHEVKHETTYFLNEQNVKNVKNEIMKNLAFQNDKGVARQ